MSEYDPGPRPRPSAPTTTALLNRLQRWTALAHDDIQFILALHGRRLDLQRGDDPFAGVDRKQFTLLMVDAWASMHKDMPSGRRVIVEFLLPGDLYVHGRHPDPSLRTAMLSAGEVFLIPAGVIAEMRARPRLQSAIRWTTKVRASIQTEWLVNIGARKAYARLAHLLCELSARANSAGLWAEDGCDMPLTQVDIASALAMSSVHLNIALQRLRAVKLIDLSNRRLTILDRPQLEAVAGFSDDYLLRWPTELTDRRNSLSETAVNDRRSPSSRRR